MKTIRLFGELGKRFGEIHRFAVNSQAEAIRALCVNYPELKNFLVNSEQQGLRYRVRNAGSDLSDLKELKGPVSGEFQLIPVFAGSGSPQFQTFLGLTLVVAGIVLSPFTGGSSLTLSKIGAALALGGIVRMISGSPSQQDIPERPENKPSYIFNGAVNTTAMGHPVPLAYGTLTVGSAVISAGITVERIQ